MTNPWPTQRWKNIMKCVPFEEKRLAKWPSPYIVQPKFDGFRCRVVPVGNGQYVLLSSEENVVFSVPHLNQMFTKLNLGVELDGELYCHGMTFEQISSIVSRTVNLHPDAEQIQFHCFDVVLPDVHQMRRCIMIESLRGLSKWLVVSPFWLCENFDEVIRVFEKVVEQGYEGIIVRHNMCPYERKRSTYIMKFKPKKSDDYIIVNSVEEVDKEGNEKGSLGALVCSSGDGTLFNVGTGFSAEQRQIFWEIRDSLPGKICRVKYQHITSGKGVPRFPVFVEVVDLIQ